MSNKRKRMARKAAKTSAALALTLTAAPVVAPTAQASPSSLPGVIYGFKDDSFVYDLFNLLGPGTYKVVSSSGAVEARIAGTLLFVKMAAPGSSARLDISVNGTVRQSVIANVLGRTANPVDLRDMVGYLRTISNSNDAYAALDRIEPRTPGLHTNRYPVPTVGSVVYTAAQAGSASFQLNDYFSDPDGDPLTYDVQPRDGYGIVPFLGGSILTISGGMPLTDTGYTISASDGKGGHAVSAFTVNAPPQPVYGPGVAYAVYYPLAQANNVTVDLDKLFLDTVPLSYSLNSPATVNGVTAAIIGGKSLQLSGPSSVDGSEFVVRASDGIEYSDVTIKLSATVPNRPPRIVSKVKRISMPIGIEGNSNLKVPLADNFIDDDNDPITYTVQPYSGPMGGYTDGGNLILTSGSLTSPAYFLISATDGHASPVTALYAIVPDNTPTAGHDVTIHAGLGTTPGMFDLRSLFTDPDPVGLSYENVTSGSNGLVVSYISGSTVSFSGTLQGTAVFTFKSRDYSYGGNTTTARLIIEPNP